METKANYVLIGAFTIAVATFGLLFLLWAANYASARNWQRYDVIFNEPVTGLTVGSSVQYNGISVGTVEELKLNPEDPRMVVANLKLQHDAPVKVDTRARLSQAGLTGSPFVQLTGGSPNAPRLEPDAANEVPIILTEPSALQNIADTANRLVERMDRMLSEENVERFANTMANIEAITGAVGSQDADLKALIGNARRATEQLNTTLDNTNRTVSTFDREFAQQLPVLVAKLDASLAKFDSAAGGADAILNENRTAINSFANDGLGQLGPTLSELRALVRDLRRISDRMDGSPARYLLGRDAPKEFTPE
ncbi:MAG: MlaD family protein [Pseudoxanthomonas suwonensis]|nr:MlaD family protein [Pseudoxanthomonas suwonensis]